MEAKSNSWSMFLQSAHELALKLGEVQSAEAIMMEREARELASIFQGWESRRPSNEARISAIQHLFDLNRRAMDFLSKHRQPGKAPPPPPSSSGSMPPRR